MNKLEKIVDGLTPEQLASLIELSNKKLKEASIKYIFQIEIEVFDYMTRTDDASDPEMLADHVGDAISDHFKGFENITIKSARLIKNEI